MRAPTNDMLWLMEAEWKSLIPANPKKGDTFAVPRSVSWRLFLYGCHNWWAAETLMQLWQPEALQQGDLTPGRHSFIMSGEHLFAQANGFPERRSRHAGAGKARDGEARDARSGRR